MPIRRLTSSRWLFLAGGMFWSLAVGAGLLALWGYQGASGAAGSPPPLWPADSGIVPDPDRANLVMLAHPHCPCTRASIGELARVMARGGHSVRAHVLFLQPEAAPPGWEESDLWQRAAAIPGVCVRKDPGGAEARRFGARTSGQVVLYGPDGALQFSGGITAARGHEGDNAGSEAIINLLNLGTPEQSATAVFGCPLEETCSQCSPPGKPRASK